MSRASGSLKARLLDLLDKDKEFRYAVAGKLGLSEILERLDRNEEAIRKLWEEVKAMREEQAKLGEGQAKLWESNNKLWEEVKALREGQAKLWESNNRLWEEVKALREGQTKLWEEVGELRKGQEELRKDVGSLRKGLEELRNEMRYFGVKLDALGARWGLVSEEAFREGMRGLLRDVGIEVERWTYRDDEGYVYGFPSEVEVDVAVSDGSVVLVELKSHFRKSDVAPFLRKAELYSRVTGRRPARLIVMSPYIDPDAADVGAEKGLEMYSGAGSEEQGVGPRQRGP
mgnify:CR=1 FL=1